MRVAHPIRMIEPHDWLVVADGKFLCFEVDEQDADATADELLTSGKAKHVITYQCVYEYHAQPN